MALLTTPVVPAGAVAQPSAPQVSSSQACMISSWRPSPSGGTAIRTRTGYRRSASRWACNDARIMRHLQVLDSFWNDTAEREDLSRGTPTLGSVALNREHKDQR